MVAQSNGAKQSGNAITLGNCAFEFVDSLRPQRDDAGRIKQFYPQKPVNCVELHKYSEGPFCKFGITASKGMAGLYALVVEGKVKYIGECQDLVWLVNNGYGTISPRVAEGSATRAEDATHLQILTALEWLTSAQQSFRERERLMMNPSGAT